LLVLRSCSKASQETVPNPGDATAEENDLSEIGSIVVRLSNARTSATQPMGWEEREERGGAFGALGSVWEEDAK
jgi:hypothetical protein